MEVILLEKVENLGGLGEVVKVAPGYARNYLVPKEKALPATEANKKRFEAQRKAFEARQAELLHHYRTMGNQIEGTTIQLDRRVAEAGRLFGSVSNADIADALKEQGFDVERGMILLPQGPMKEVGDHEVHVRLHPDVTVTITVSIAGI
ncbi:50S ribosomal protein L9 [Thiohalorhabdus methylotrophus]|uniref:Large ribosomal subunit protein bL9 n=1 Tax=Thiohalorhabdus methylotrophus TaxID=3242694 RepID=A0ABV4U1Z9_9GAMM